MGSGVASMAIDHVLVSLSRVPLFAGLTPAQIADIGRGAQRRAFGSGEVITRVGDPGNGAYLILSGEAESSTDPAGAEALEPGSLVGELAMFIDHTYGTTVVALEWVDCLKIERATLAEQMRRDPDIADRIADVIRGRVAVIAADLRIVDRLLTRSSERCNQAPRALPAPPREAPGQQAEGALEAA